MDCGVYLLRLVLGNVRGVCQSFGPRVLAICETQRYTGDQDGFGRLRDSAFFGWLDTGNEDDWFGKKFLLLVVRLLTIVVLGRCIGLMAWKGRTPGPCGMLLCKPLHEAFQQRER